MLWPWMHLIVGVVLIVAVIVGLAGPAKGTKIWAMIARVCYILILISGILMFARAWREDPVLLVIKIMVALVFIGLAEAGFAKKTRGTAGLSALWIPLALGVVTFALGLALTGGFPLF